MSYIFYDKHFEDQAVVGFMRTTTAANSFEELSLSFTADKEGYLFVYVSNEEPSAKEVYFDDFKITHTPTVVTQTDSYCSFGLSYGNIIYLREGRTKNQFLYNCKEIVEGFDLGWYDYGARYFAPDLGRWQPNGFIVGAKDRFVLIDPYENVPYN